MQCNGNFKQWFNIFLIISEAWQGYESKAYGVSNHNLKLQSKKLSRTRDIPNFPTQGWADTAFCTRNWSETYLSNVIFVTHFPDFCTQLKILISHRPPLWNSIRIFWFCRCWQNPLIFLQGVPWKTRSKKLFFSRVLVINLLFNMLFLQNEDFWRNVSILLSENRGDPQWSRGTVLSKLP